MKYLGNYRKLKECLILSIDCLLKRIVQYIKYGVITSSYLDKTTPCIYKKGPFENKCFHFWVYQTYIFTNRAEDRVY